MRRSYRQDRYLGIIEQVRRAMPDAAITTDIIVGFPGRDGVRLRADPARRRKARFAGAFTFQYSKRPGTLPRPRCPTRVPQTSRRRYERLVALSRALPGRRTPAFVGRDLDVLVAEVRVARTPRRCGCRAVHRTTVSSTSRPVHRCRAPATSTVEVNHAAPHHLVADGPEVLARAPYSCRRRLGGPTGRREADRRPAWHAAFSPN